MDTEIDDTEAYYKGWSAGYNDYPPDNPYTDNTREYSDWDRGYKDGAHDG
jgi:hypothetical protein